jgi:hypothetical protein
LPHRRLPPLTTLILETEADYHQRALKLAAGFTPAFKHHQRILLAVLNESQKPMREFSRHARILSFNP